MTWGILLAIWTGIMCLWLGYKNGRRLAREEAAKDSLDGGDGEVMKEIKSVLITMEANAKFAPNYRATYTMPINFLGKEYALILRREAEEVEL